MKISYISKATGSIVTKFYAEPPGVKEHKIISHLTLDSHSMTIPCVAKAIGPIVTKFYVEPSRAGEQKLLKFFWSHDQHGHHAHIW